jgi:hypothetical protein
MQTSTRLFTLADEDTQPLPAIQGLTFQLYLESHALTIRDVALAAQVRLLVIWNIQRGHPVLAEDAGKVRAALFTLTRERYRGPIPVRATPPLSPTSHGQFTQRLARVL